MSDALSSLSTRELQVFELIATGTAPARTARRLGLSVKTVSTYRARILRKLGVRSNAEIAILRAKDVLALAADHTVLAAAICAGVARWEPFETGATGEIVVDGLRYFAALDAHGVPALHDLLRAKLFEGLKRVRSAAPMASAA